MLFMSSIAIKAIKGAGKVKSYRSAKYCGRNGANDKDYDISPN